MASSLQLDVQSIDDPTALSRLQPDWCALSARAWADEPMNAPPWLATWWRVFGGDGGRRLRLVLVREGGQLVGLFALVARGVRAVPELPLPRLRRLDALGSGEDEADEVCSDYLGPLCVRGREDTVCTVLARALAAGAAGRHDELVVPSMAGASPVTAALARALTACGYATQCAATPGAPYIPLPARFDDYLSALPSRRRYLVRRARRELEAWAGEPPRLHEATDTASLAHGLHVLRTLHAERWRAAGRAGVFASARFARFHDEVTRELLARGALELTWLTARDAPVAAAYNLVWNDKVSFYQAGRSLAVPPAVRPGLALHALLIERAIAMGRREYDFLAGESRYKRELALAVRPLVTLRALRPGLRASLATATRDLRSYARTLLTRVRNPWLAGAPATPGTTDGGAASGDDPE